MDAKKNLFVVENKYKKTQSSDSVLKINFFTDDDKFFIEEKSQLTFYPRQHTDI